MSEAMLFRMASGSHALAMLYTIATAEPPNGLIGPLQNSLCTVLHPLAEFDWDVFYVDRGWKGGHKPKNLIAVGSMQKLYDLANLLLVRHADSTQR